MVERVDTAFVRIFGHLVGAVAWSKESSFATFEFEKQFLDRNLDLAPITMPLAQARRGSARFAFPALPTNTFMGLPGLLADALPDSFGNALIDQWLARQGRTREDFSPIERLCYTGKRAMGALEFAPALHNTLDQSVPVQIEALVELAQQVIQAREALHTRIDPGIPDAMLDILRVGTSAGGGRPKAVIAIDETSGEVRSGQVDAPETFVPWLIKFDGVQDTTLGDPAGYGRIEYAYYKMALATGITMSPCRLLEEGGRAHFMTQRFDRPGKGKKLHLQSLCAIAHFDFNAAGAYAYEQAFQAMRQLRLPYEDALQQFRRMVFNVVARNQDDHTKNIAFIMQPDGRWRLSPAFDVTYAYNPTGAWTQQHQMTIRGKRDNFTRADLLAVGEEMNVKPRAKIIDEVIDGVSRWGEFAKDAGVEPANIRAIGATHRLLAR